MPSTRYQSRYLPACQTVLTGRIRSAERYAIHYDIARDAMTRGELRPLSLPKGTLMVRSTRDVFDAQAARTIPPGSSMSVHNRYNGARLDGRPGSGALYLGTVAGVLRERAHYASLPAARSPLRPAAPALIRPGAPGRVGDFIRRQASGAADPGQQLHLYTLTRAVQLADLRSTALAPLFARLLASGEGVQRYGLVDHVPFDFMVRAVADPNDFSAARGLADAVADTMALTGWSGVCAHSARGDRDDGWVVQSHGDPTCGLVMVLFGADGRAAIALAPARPQATFGSFADLRAAIA
jgi:hypothetical protein